MKRGDILLLSFPFSDLSSVKVRPALVVSSDNFNATNDEMVFLLITSNTDHIRAEDILVGNGAREFAGTGLKASSVFRVGRIHSLHKRLVRRKLGCAAQPLMQSVEARLRELLALP